VLHSFKSQMRTESFLLYDCVKHDLVGHRRAHRPARAEPLYTDEVQDEMANAIEVRMRV
jgi:hypothetical protein